VPTAADALLEEVDSLLEGLQRRYAGRPDLERRALLMVALQREQVVAVAYREDAVADRVAGLAVDEAVRALIHQCLVWIWKDEEVHATYLRGYLLRTGRRLPAALVFGRQIYGGLSGWITSTRELTRTSDAPVRGIAADVMLTMGRVVGLVPAAVARELGYHSFRRYCQLNAVLERTAELAYHRLVQLPSAVEERDLFSRIEEDERRHGEAFDVLAGLLDEDDQPVPGLMARDLRDRLAAISPWFIPASMRDGSAGRRPFGVPSPVHVSAGAGPADVGPSVRQVLDRAGLGTLVADQGGRVAIRTSFMLGYDRRDRSNVVSPAVLHEVAAYVIDHGASDVAVIEAPTVYGRYFAHRSVGEVAAYFGYTSPLYRIVDADADQRPFSYQRGLQQNSVSGTWIDADVRVVLAKLRTDPTEFGHLCLSSLEGMSSEIADTFYTAKEVDFRSATMMLLDVAPPDLAVVDAWGPLADGPLGVMGCHDPALAWRVYAGRDALSVDRAVLDDMGLADASRAPIIRRAIHWFGLELGPVDVHGSPGRLGGGFRHPWSRPTWRAMTMLSYPVYVYLSGQGRLFVPDMDEIAFPSLTGEPWPVRATRRGAQLVFGTRPMTVVPEDATMPACTLPADTLPADTDTDTDTGATDVGVDDAATSDATTAGHHSAVAATAPGTPGRRF